MSQYKGLKSLDAEIILDVEKGIATFDYSLNIFSGYDSNISCELSNSNPKKDILANFLQPIILIPFLIFIGVITWLKILILDPLDLFEKYQVYWQKFLKFGLVLSVGYNIQTSVGQLENNKILFNIERNVWFDYKLDGDYQEQIKKISLFRHFAIIERFGVIKHIQRGWDVIFEFKNPPQDGNLILRSLA